jgi:hypothetical protein
MNPTPTPMPDVGLETLWEHISIPRPEDRPIVLAWILATRNNIPAPILLIEGGPDSGKTDIVTRLVSLVSSAEVQRGVPGWYELMVAFAGGDKRAVAFDDVFELSGGKKQQMVRLLLGVTMTSYDRCVTIRANAVLGGLVMPDGHFDRGMSHAVMCLESQGKRTSDDAWGNDMPGILWAILELDARVAMLGRQVVDIHPSLIRMLDFCQILEGVDTVLGTHSLDFFHKEALTVK